MDGSIQERGKGSYRLIVSMGFDQNGKRIKKQKTVKAKNKAEANKHKADTHCKHLDSLSKEGVRKDGKEG